MKYIVTGNEMKEYDNNTMTHQGISGLTLMENAARAMFVKIMSLKILDKKVLIVCGIGNNGGDGLALARMLVEEGREVDVCIVGNIDKGTESFQIQHQRLKKLPVGFISKEKVIKCETNKYSLIVDALFGVGLSREISGEYADIIEKCNALEGYKLAVDIPSGICADNGRILGCAFRADATVTFAFGKAGLYLYPGATFAGETEVADIGITELAFETNPPKLFTYDENPYTYLPKRKPDGNKGTFGKLLVIAGFETMAGAAILCSRAALQMGTGMVKVICAPENRGILQTAVPEVLYGTVNDWQQSVEWADGIVIGPGLGKSEEVRALLENILSTCKMPLVMDADALNLISENTSLQELIRDYAGNKILTPHVGELARLAKLSNKDVKENLLNVAKGVAKEYHSIVVAKDARTFVIEGEGPAYLNTTGNDGMATAGSGDVLAGMVGALICQGLKSFEAACAGVYLHGLAGDSARDYYTEYGVTASRLIENIRNFEQ